MLNAELIKATRGIIRSKNGLITIKVVCPRFVWLELLTHRTAARNASSHRAMNTDRTTDLGYYEPLFFYKASKGMQSSNEPIGQQFLARLIWRANWRINTFTAKLLEKLDVCKEQRNRVLPTYANIVGFITMTEHSWQHFISLRTKPNADKAMQELASIILARIQSVKWEYNTVHIPFDPGIQYTNEERMKIAAGTIAWISFNKTFEDALRTTDKLIRDNHQSPLEHVAVWTQRPKLSALFCKEQDSHTIVHGEGSTIFYNSNHWQSGYGWNTYRNIVESRTN